MRHPEGALAVLNRLVQKAAMRLRQQDFYASSMSVQVRCELRYARESGGERWAQVGETQDTAFLLSTLQDLWDSGLYQLQRPVSVGVQMHGLVPAAQHTSDLFDALVAASPASTTSPPRDRSRLLAAVDTLNRKHGKNAVMFASAHAGRDHAPMRIAFNRIPDLDSER
jgi:DNA polymerase-4